MTAPKYARVGRRRISLEDDAWKFLRTGEPRAMRWLSWRDSAGNHVGNAQEVWARHREQFTAELPGDAYAFDFFK